MKYSINIAKDNSPEQTGPGRFSHYGRLELPEGLTDAQALEVFVDACHRYRKSDGFILSLTRWNTVGRELASNQEA